MEITPELVERIADLSRLELDPAEVRAAAAELERMLEHMAVLGQLDAEPASPVPQEWNVLREDEPAPSLDRARLLAGAPASDGESFLVPLCPFS